MRGHISSLVLSFLLAFCLWLSLAGQDTSAVDLPVPLELGALPEGLVIRGELPKEVTLRLRANTAQLKFLADRKMSLPLDLSLAREGLNVLPVPLEFLNLPRGVQVSEVAPGLLEFETLRVAAKKVPLEPKIVGRPDTAYRLEGVTLEPDEVTLHGPPEALEKISRLTTTPIAVSGLTRDAVFAVSAAPPSGAPETILILPKEIQAAVSVEEVRTQAVFSNIPVEMEVRKGGPARASFIAKPARVSVTVSWPLSRSRPVDAREVLARVSVDAEQLEAEGQITLPVVAVPPSGVTVTAISPVQVSVSYVSGAAEPGPGGAGSGKERK